MSEELTIYEKAVTTDRPAEMLAQKHGFESVAALAEALPPEASVLDVGAGASPFGHEVAELRPDVTWVNFDYSYGDPAILNEVQAIAPSNVAFVAGDATRLTDVYEPGSFDAVFSYWLMPHLSIDDEKPALDAASAMYQLVKDGGIVSVGPKTSKRKMPSFKSQEAYTVTKDLATNPDDFAKQVVDRTKLSGLSLYTQRLANEVTTPFFGTTRYARREGRIPHIYDPEVDSYISPLSKRGVQIAGSLAVAAYRHAKNIRSKE